MRGTIIFDGVDLSQFGVYYDGSKEYDKPVKETERVSIPGRNGDVFLPKNRWSNIPIVFNCYIKDDFQSNYSELVAFLNSRSGYKVLETSGHPDVYREAMFVSAVSPAMGQFNKTGTFDIEFDCKPQRFLKSGLQTTEITGGSGTISNPTFFESSPLLTVYGAGTIGINDETITIKDDAYGSIQLTDRFILTAGTSKTVSIADLFNEGDYITFENGTVRVMAVVNAPVISASASFTGTLAPETYNISTSSFGGIVTLTFTLNQNIQALPSSMTYQTVSFTLYIETSNGTGTVKGYLSEYIYPTSEEVKVQTEFTQQSGTVIVQKSLDASVNGITGVSTVGGSWPFMVDLDSLKAYKDTGGQVVNLNHLVEFGTEAPTLQPGENEITSDTYPSTQVDIVPRWWTL